MDLLTPARRVKHRVFLARRGRRLRREAATQRQDPGFRARYDRVSAGMNLPELPHHRGVWAVAMVRNEADVIETSLRHLVAQGVEHILVVDNMSEDETPAVLTRLAAELPGLHVGRDTVAAYHQSEKMTFLADRVASAGATFVIPFDADELWFAPRGRLADVLTASAAPLQRAHLFNLFPEADAPGWRLDPVRHFDDKVAFRPARNAVVAMGNHEVTRPGRQDPDGLRILHLPWRSFDQFARKTRVGAAAVALADLPEDKAYHWRRLGVADDDALRAMWRELLAGRPVTDAAWYPRGELVTVGERLPTSWPEVERLLPTAPR